MTALTHCVTSVFRGVAQIFFIDNVWTGLLITVGMALASPEAALFLLLGSAVQSLGAWAVGLRSEASHGLMGFNGALVGAASLAYAGFTGMGMLLTCIGALAVVAVHQLVAALFASQPLARFGLPVSTAPFCIVASAYFLLLPELTPSAPLSSSAEPLVGTLLGVANSFSEVILADGWLTGLLIFIGMFIGSRSTAGFGLLGAVIIVAGSVLVTGQWTLPSTGTLSYPAVLAAAALGAVFWNHLGVTWRITGAVAASVLTPGFYWLLSAQDLPVLTWPFLMSMWVVMVVGAVIRRSAVDSSETELDEGDDMAGQEQRGLER